MTDLARYIVEIARCFWGPENRALSSRTELRWGREAPARSTQDRAMVRHEAVIGGGVVDLITHEAPNERPSDWLRRHGFADDLRPINRSAPPIRPAIERATAGDNRRRTEQAYEVLEKAVPIGETTLGLAYYALRGIRLDDEILNSGSLWFVDQCATYVDGKLVKLPAIVAKLVDIRSNKFCAISRLFLGLRWGHPPGSLWTKNIEVACPHQCPLAPPLAFIWTIFPTPSKRPGHVLSNPSVMPAAPRQNARNDPTCPRALRASA
jgi:hypothetical protein